MSGTVYRNRELNPINGTPSEVIKGRICSLLAESNEYMEAKDFEYELHITERQRKYALSELVEEGIVVKHKHPDDGRKCLYGLRGFWTERPPGSDEL